MKRVLLLGIFVFIAGCVCEETSYQYPATWDCGEECIAGCAFLSPKKQMICKADCMVCDGRDSPAFTSPPEDAGPPGWLPKDGGRD